MAVGLLLIALALGPGRTLWAVYAPPSGARPLPAQLVAHSSDKGAKLLERADLKGDVDTLLERLTPQEHAHFGGIAAAVTALRARGHDVTQDSFFTPEVIEIRSKWKVLFGGLQIRELRWLLNTHGVGTDTFLAKTSTLSDFRRRARKQLSVPGEYVIVWFMRPALGLVGKSQYALLAAHEPFSDRFLLIDPAVEVYPPYWVTAQDLHDAMLATDLETIEGRGYILMGPPPE